MSNFQNESTLKKLRSGHEDILKGISNDGQARFYRVLAETILKKIIDIDVSEKLMLGQAKSRFKAYIKNHENSAIASFDISSVLDAIEICRLNGNTAGHSNSDEVLDSDIDNIKKAIDELYVFLCIKFFTKYPIKADENIYTQKFSLLTPEIRYKALYSLQKNDPTNWFLTDRLVITMTKARGKGFAIEWLKSNKEAISNIEEPLDFAPTWYEYFLESIKLISENINQKGVMYSTLEEAKELYLRDGYIDNVDEQAQEFNNIIEFIFLGRVAIDNPKIREEFSYLFATQDNE
ncbi:hypothetical protein [Wohlfahrtiimonas chitiniclastica]|uniref:hypothetical protein n=1 Tax=Wohlfahrtiimonas chitiniclastica TaxID=400946 RepID=UPI001BCF49B1|nr:hypothetical protein [Wohlfahrtiimonas chitiniclastica]MBS7815879.1 hypothetical protein [Wohlfahrtiimonas chitiniclastica]MBS7822126.1 hypothetical protein [Wohlfahrtiimonas chitiniclastica]MBS7829918.1 hypothetical protein [Wohlfahrtiimonas chitiniclastica]MBS7831885.1 hypothetical protein [Wohlfahrtiimonas chitiniclastica]